MKRIILFALAISLTGCSTSRFRLTPGRELKSPPGSEALEFRKVYRYSVVSGGYRNKKEFERSMTDSVVARHYNGLSFSRTLPVSQPLFMYVSYRKGNAVYWTSAKHKIPTGEILAVMTTGDLARTRCGNRLSFSPRQPVEVFSPTEKDLDDHEYVETSQASPLRPSLIESPVATEEVSNYIPALSIGNLTASDQVTPNAQNQPLGFIGSFPGSAYGFPGFPGFGAAVAGLIGCGCLCPVSGGGGAAIVGTVGSSVVPEPHMNALVVLGLAVIVIGRYGRVRLPARRLHKAIIIASFTAFSVLMFSAV